MGLFRAMPFYEELEADVGPGGTGRDQPPQYHQSSGQQSRVVTASGRRCDVRESTSVGSRELGDHRHETPAEFPLPIPYIIPGMVCIGTIVRPNTLQQAALTAQCVSAFQKGRKVMSAPSCSFSFMAALFADTSGDMNDVLDHPIAGSFGANEELGSTANHPSSMQIILLP
uniref:Uncharacterized protein n=1 Tax=Sphaerodactylus townsendi TaxID=933632 RepID=A0ACB8FAW8_9SAUR